MYLLAIPQQRNVSITVVVSDVELSPTWLVYK